MSNLYGTIRSDSLKNERTGQGNKSLSVSAQSHMGSVITTAFVFGEEPVFYIGVAEDSSSNSSRLVLELTSEQVQQLCKGELKLEVKEA